MVQILSNAGSKTVHTLAQSHPYYTHVYDTLSLNVIHCQAFLHRCIELTVRLERITRSVFRIARLFELVWAFELTLNIFTQSVSSLNTGGRTYGIPSVRTDLPVPSVKRVSDKTNYGDSSTVRALLNPSVYASHGVHEEHFNCPRTKTEVRTRSVWAWYIQSWFGNIYCIKHYLAFSCATLKHDCQFGGKVTYFCLIGDQIWPISYNTLLWYQNLCCLVQYYIFNMPSRLCRMYSRNVDRYMV